MTFDPRWLGVGGAVGILAILAGVMAVGYLATPPSSSPPVHVELAIVQDPSTGSYGFSPASIQVPVGALVQMRITNYDPANHSVDPIYCNVTGTMDGTMDELGGGMGSMMGHAMARLAPGGVAHTFTMRSGGYDVNVPIPPATSAHTPSVIEFSFTAHGPGAMTWTCETVMAGSNGAPGGWTGLFTVT